MKQLNALLLSSLSLFLITSCGKKSNNSNDTVAVPGGSAVRGSLILSPECGPTANVRLLSQNQSQTYYNVTVNNGGTFDFQIAPGTYVLATQTGTSCNYLATVDAIQNNVSPYQVCVGSSCGGQTYTQPASYQTTVPNGYYDPNMMNYSTYNNCSWNIYGCMGYPYPGTGNAAFGKPNIYFNSKVDIDFNLNLDFTKGSNLLASSPSHGTKGWKGKIKKDGTVLVDNTSYPFLFYDVQTDDKLLQAEEGFCDSRDKIVGQMKSYLVAAGFSDKATLDFEKIWKNQMPPNEIFCAYPQDESNISKIVNYKSNLNFKSKKIWFLLVPEINKVVQKIKPIPKNYVQYFNKPKTNAFASLKKKVMRYVANEGDISSEEWAIGFLLEK